jgi:late competence protein required for DNA uptake (superfamily II DNA/RNA helicase)
VLRYAPRFHEKKLTKKKFDRKKKFKKKIQNISVKKKFQIFLAIGVPQPIWGMPAKIWGV